MALTKTLQKQEESFLSTLRQSVTAEARTKLAAQIAEAKNAQNKAIDDAKRIKIVDNADKPAGVYMDKLDGDTFWDKLVAVAVEGKKAGLHPYVVISAVNEELGNPDSIDARAGTVKQYRSKFPKVASLYMDDAALAAAAPLVVNAKGEHMALDKDNNPLPLDRVGFATAYKAFTLSEKTGEERQFAEELRALTAELKEAGKPRAENKKEGIVALDAVPLKDLIASVQAFRGMIPSRSVKAMPNEPATQQQDSEEAAQDEQQPQQGNVRAA
jgi:hypothetical protein